jgi:acetoin utilization deacetylase AcuC-like enzyme
MRCFFDPRQLAHAPIQELSNGAWVPHAEHPGRARSILDAIGTTETPLDHGDRPLLRVHVPDYLAFLRTAHQQWEEAGRSGDAAGYVWPVRRRPLRLERIDALLGRYSYDVTTPIGPGSWNSAYWAAQTAVEATGAALHDEGASFALCRPPGHHCGADYLGGYCYLNNAAIAAEAAIAAGRQRVAILDIDYHHGNGTQDIFYARGDVLTVSIHADPATDYPFFWGHADETGEGDGEGATLNLPLPRGTAIETYRPAMDAALERIAAFGADMLVCSFGADTFVDDPISHFALETRDFALLARQVASLGLPTVIVMEGGYAVDALGANVAAFLSGF